MRSALLSCVATAALVLAACGGGTTKDDRSSGQPDDQQSQDRSGSESSDPGSPDVASLIEAEANPVELLISTLDDRLATADQLDRSLVESLAEAAGITTVLGDGAASAIDDVLSAQAAAVEAEWRLRDIDPDAARAALGGPAPAVVGFRSVDAGIGGVMALTTTMMSAFEPIFSRRPDPSTGRLVDQVHVAATIPPRAGPLTITLDESVDIDLGFCPSADGFADGTVTIDATMSATGVVDGEPVDLRASAIYTITIDVRSTANGQLAGTDASLTGTVVSSNAEGDAAYADAEGLGVSMPFDGDGEPATDQVQGHGTTQGTESTIDAFSEVLLKVTALLGYAHARSAQSYWSSGGCIRLESHEPLAPLVGEYAEIEVRAVHAVDATPVVGTLSATPLEGEVDPTTGQAPATFRITVTEGEPVARSSVEFRSFRGIATTDLTLDARGFRVSLGDVLKLTGEKCDGQVGVWNLAFGGSVEESGMVIHFSGPLVVTVAADLSATYHIDMKGTVEGLPAQLSAALNFVGDGRAVFVDDPDAPRIDLLDGDLATVASGSGPDLSISGVVTQGPAGQASIMLTRAACQSTG